MYCASTGPVSRQYWASTLPAHRASPGPLLFQHWISAGPLLHHNWTITACRYTGPLHCASIGSMLDPALGQHNMLELTQLRASCSVCIGPVLVIGIGTVSPVPAVGIGPLLAIDQMSREQKDLRIRIEDTKN